MKRKKAGEDYSPSIIANYTYDLVKEYNQFYHDFSILREENEAVKVFRIALSANVAKVVRLGMGLLGIEVPARKRCCNDYQSNTFFRLFFLWSRFPFLGCTRFFFVLYLD